MLTTTKLVKMLTSITIRTDNFEVISKNNLKLNLPNSKKTKITKTKSLRISSNIGINIKATRF